jgi:hypothetical protein
MYSDEQFSVQNMTLLLLKLTFATVDTAYLVLVVSLIQQNS